MRGSEKALLRGYVVSMEEIERRTDHGRVAKKGARRRGSIPEAWMEGPRRQRPHGQALFKRSASAGWARGTTRQLSKAAGGGVSPFCRLGHARA